MRANPFWIPAFAGMTSTNNRLLLTVIDMMIDLAGKFVKLSGCKFPNRTAAFGGSIFESLRHKQRIEMPDA
jgi:hypothetical protein